MRFRPSPTLSICLIAAAIATVGLIRPAADPAPVSATQFVDISGFAFTAVPTAAPGTSIAVRNLDGVPHTLTARDGSFNTGLIDGNGTGNFALPPAAGTYEFFCELHPSMTGELTIP